MDKELKTTIIEAFRGLSKDQALSQINEIYSNSAAGEELRGFAEIMLEAILPALNRPEPKAEPLLNAEFAAKLNKSADANRKLADAIIEAMKAAKELTEGK